jgi:hypothetical protein
MNDKLSDERALQLLRAALPPRRDERSLETVWPRVRRQIDRGPLPPSLMDWTLAVVVALLCLLQPSLAGILMLHF